MTKRYLKRSAESTFLLFMLGIPVLIWMYSLVVELNKRMPVERRININFFRILLIGLCIIYILLVLGIVDPFENMWLIQTFILFGFFNIISTSLVFTRFEEVHSIEPSSGLLSFFQIWVYPIGIWYLQPKLNDYIEYPVDGRQ